MCACSCPCLFFLSCVHSTGQRMAFTATDTSRWSLCLPTLRRTSSAEYSGSTTLPGYESLHQPAHMHTACCVLRLGCVCVCACACACMCACACACVRACSFSSVPALLGENFPFLSLYHLFFWSILLISFLTVTVTAELTPPTPPTPPTHT